jgi:hypothetical protein
VIIFVAVAGLCLVQSSRFHPKAGTTPKIRQEIDDSGLSSSVAAGVFNVTRAAAQK